MPAPIDQLLYELCVKYGYCGCVKFGKPLHVRDFIPPDGPVHVAQFVEWVLLADDVNPNSPDKHTREMKAAFTELFTRYLGAETVDASLLLSQRVKGKQRWLTD